MRSVNHSSSTGPDFQSAAIDNPPPILQGEAQVADLQPAGASGDDALSSPQGAEGGEMPASAPSPSDLMVKGHWGDEFSPNLGELDTLAQAADFPYHHNQPERITAIGYHIDTEASRALAQQAGLNFNEATGCISSSHGLCAFWLKNDQGNNILTFGGTTSGHASGGFARRSVFNVGEQVSQWTANAKNALLKRVPDCYKEAQHLGAFLANQHLAANEQLTFTGHSLGGGMATYASGMASRQDRMVKCMAFCAAELCPQMINDIKTHLGEDFDRWLEGVTQIYIKGDPVPHMHKLFSAVQNVGHRYTVHPTSSSSFVLNPGGRHVDFAKYVSEFCQKMQAQQSASSHVSTGATGND